jgi:hypothetical protein
VLFQKIGPRNEIHPRPILMISSDVVPGLSMTSVLTTCHNRRVCFPLLKIIASTVVMFSLSLKLRISFGNSCNVILYDVKSDGDCISGLTFVWGNLIWSCVSVVYRDFTRQAKGLYRLKHVGALGSGLAYLSRCNSGWFCHSSHHLHLELEVLFRSQGWRHRHRLAGTLVVLPLQARTGAGAPGVHHLIAAERNL